MLPRFLVSELDAAAGTATLTGGEAHHLTRVLRLPAGVEVAVFDGRGSEYRARVERIAGGTVVVRLLEPLASVPGRQVPITLAQAVLKGSSMDEVVRDATMMGVGQVVPLITAHTVAHRAAAPHAVERWRRVAIASAKQCRAPRLPDVRPPMSFDDWLRQLEGAFGVLMVEPSVEGVEPLRVRELASRPQPDGVAVAVGPEGGWATAEVTAALQAGLVPVTLGTLTLRAEAVPLAVLAALSVIWN